MIKESDLKIEFMRGQGPGGQHKNKTDSACRITHIPTGITAYCDERSQAQSKKEALKTLERRLEEYKQNILAKNKKEKRDKAIKNKKHIRTYNYKRNEVIDHRTNKRGSIKDILIDGNIDKLK